MVGEVKSLKTATDTVTFSMRVHFLNTSLKTLLNVSRQEVPLSNEAILIHVFSWPLCSLLLPQHLHLTWHDAALCCLNRLNFEWAFTMRSSGTESKLLAITHHTRATVPDSDLAVGKTKRNFLNKYGANPCLFLFIFPFLTKWNRTWIARTHVSRSIHQTTPTAHKRNLTEVMLCSN